MSTVHTLINKELKVAFNSLLIYIAFTIFFCFEGFICWFSWLNIFSIGQASLVYLFNILYWGLFFLIPALTMKSIAEERKVGTFGLLLSKPIQIWQIVSAKFFALLLQLLVCLVLTLPYYITIAYLAHVDHFAGFCGYLGLILMGSCYISIGMFTSALTTNPIIAFFTSYGLMVGFQFFFDIVAEICGSGFFAVFFNYISMGEHFDAICRGVIDSKDIIYSISIVFIFLALTRYYISRSRN